MLFTKTRSRKIFPAIFFLLFLTLTCKSSKEVKPRWVPSFISKVPALDALPVTKFGYIDWVKAMNEGIIQPLASLDPNHPVKEEFLDLNIHFKNTKGGLLSVIFPHLPHTKWLKCKNCHPAIFKAKRGANPITMTKIAKGQYCGRCHGVVAFPLNHCLRCHSGPILSPEPD